MTTSIFHLAEPQAWTDAQANGAYAVSTRGRTLAEEGFIHCSDEAQWPVARRNPSDWAARPASRSSYTASTGRIGPDVCSASTG